MSQDEIIVDKVNFIKRIAEKYDLVYEEHKQGNGDKNFKSSLESMLQAQKIVKMNQKLEKMDNDF